jgi:magnesium-transporting ATPase (P-type)
LRRFKNESEEVLRDAYLISHFQTGLKNVLDRAVLKYSELHRELSVDKYTKVDEIPFDFSRRMMSVVVEGPDGQRQLLTKGAPESVFKKCTHFESDGEIFPMEPILVGNLIEQVNSLSEDGFRVLAIANKKVGAQNAYSKADEENLVLTGYLAFLDPPKDTAKTAITALRQHGVTVKVLTGDNDLVTRKVCTEVGINAEKSCWATTWKKCPTSNWPRRLTARTSMRAFRPRTKSASCRRSRKRATSSASWATASTTRPRCAPPTWAFPWTRRWTSPRNPPT